MSDRYSQIVHLPVVEALAKNVGLPVPTPLKRFSPGDPVLDGTAMLGGASGGRLGSAIEAVLESAGVTIAREPRPGHKHRALVFDATGITRADELGALHAFFSPGIRDLKGNGRMLVLGTPPESLKDPRERTAQRALEGFVRSLAKEARGGSTAQLVYVAKGAERQIEATLRFLLSAKSAFVDAQVIRVGKVTGKAPELDWAAPLAGKRAVVTGASRGIGAAIAATLARDGAHVIGVDVPALGADLRAVTESLGGTAVELDITADDAAERLIEHGPLDIIVHNAGITRDRSLAAMSAEQWDQVLGVNLVAAEEITHRLLEADAIPAGGRVVGVASISGIAGNTGQTNYAASKAGVIGLVDGLAPVLGKQGATINAVAPGFIETQMTAKVPFAIREAGRRMSSLSQGGLPVDVAETIAWFASPGSAGVNGNVVRVCGQSLLGA